MELGVNNEKATLIRLNKDDSRGFSEPRDTTIAFTEDMQKVISSLSVVKGVKMSQLQIKDYSSFIQLEDKYPRQSFPLTETRKC